MRITIWTALVAATFMCATAAQAQTLLPFRGYLEQDGVPVSGQVEMDFAYFGQATGGTACSTENAVLVDVAAGEFSVLLVPADACLDGPLFLEVSLQDGSGAAIPIGGRQRIHSAATAYAASSERSFSAPLGVDFVSNGAALTPTAAALVATGPEGGDVAVEVLASSPNDAFDVRIVALPGASGGVVPGSALTVSANGHTAVRTFSATTVDADSVAATSSVTAGVVNADVVNADEINGAFSTVDGSAGCMRIGDIQQCWGPYSSAISGTYLAVTFSQPFLNASYAITCTPNGGAVADRRFCQTRGCTSTGCGVRTASGSGFSGIGGRYIAIGPWR